MSNRPDHDALLARCSRTAPSSTRWRMVLRAGEERGDLIQDIVIEMVRASRVRRARRFSTWMHQIAVNGRDLAFAAQVAGTRCLPIEEFGMDLAAADRAMDADHDLIALQQLIAQLEPVNRALILLYLEGYAQEEIATMLGLSTTNVATRINRIKQRLQRNYAAAETAP